MNIPGQTGFSKSWGLRASVSSPPPPFPFPFRTFLRSPQFSRVQKAKNASNLQKALRRRLVRRQPDWGSGYRHGNLSLDAGEGFP